MVTSDITVTNGLVTPPPTNKQIIIVLPYNGTPTPLSRPKPNVYYSWNNKLYLLSSAMGIEGEYVPLSRTITINGDTKDLSQNRSWNVLGDNKVKVSLTDTTSDFLYSKLEAGDGVSLVKTNPSGNEKVRISFNANNTKDVLIDCGSFLAPNENVLIDCGNFI